MTVATCRLTMGDTGSSVLMDDVFPPRRSVRDITADVNERFFIKIPRGSQVAKASMCVIGSQGCGKSVLLESMCAHAVKKYGADKVHTIYTDDIRVALDLLDDTPVQLVIIDDAMTYASSRQVSNQTEIIKVYNRSRHVFEEIRNGKPGLILYIWAWQRFKELDPSFRQTDITIFKTGISEYSERKLIGEFIGPWYQNILDNIWDRINRGNNAIKSTSVARISSLRVSMGTGLYKMPMVRTPHFPAMITHEEHFKNEDAEEDILGAIADKPEWAMRVEIYKLYNSKKPDGTVYTQNEVAEIIGLKRGARIRQGYVSESLRKVKAYIEER